MTGEPVEFRSAVVSAVDYAERVIELIAVPYDQETMVEYRGMMLRETVAPGAFDDVRQTSPHVTVNRDHDYGRTVGKAVEFEPRDPRGLIARARISRTPLGDETLQLADDRVLRASVAMLVARSGQVIREGARRINRAKGLDHIALLPNAAYAGAEVLAVRHAPVTEDGPLPATPNLDSLRKLLAG